jgi:lysozyme
VNYSDELVPFMQAWEGLKLKPSPDRIRPDIIDIGYGHVILPGEDLGPDHSITKAEAVQLLEYDLYWRAEIIDSRMLTAPVPQCMFDALLSFAYNVGLDDDDDTKPEGLGDSALLRFVNAGDFEAAYAEWMKWIHGNGEVVPGLVNRRRAELAIAQRGDYSVRP